MIYIARNFQGKVVGIVSARNEKAVRAYYQGTKLRFNTITPFDIDEDRENEKMGYVTPILETKETYASPFGTGPLIIEVV